MAKLGVSWYANGKMWMTNPIFKQWKIIEKCQCHGEKLNKLFTKLKSMHEYEVAKQKIKGLKQMPSRQFALPNSIFIKEKKIY